eukprot:CAMPEP_0184706930 /NCGR_PEP_ID=MMETSP0313-20130426/37012_1 /TAXON_ID=2792 /ORGANISM="Porphyridium aerugineum, Strain SAG 1380-2" /LENGTH=197 /DNA_ID=CAMNT_0027168499 /DNA_START=475 /DNA_END=1065 /DNA_ORIENTATION=-
MTTSISDIQLHVLTFGRGDPVDVFTLIIYFHAVITANDVSVPFGPDADSLLADAFESDTSQSQNRSHRHNHSHNHGYESGSGNGSGNNNGNSSAVRDMSHERIRPVDSQSQSQSPSPVRKIYMRKLDKLQLLERAAPERLQQDMSSIPFQSNLSHEPQDRVSDTMCACSSASTPLPTPTASPAICVICLDELKPGTW